MANLEFSEVLGRAIRQGEGDSIGRSTLREAFDLLDADDVDGAKALLLYMMDEQRTVQDICVQWIWALLTWIQESVGEQSVEFAMRETLGSWGAKRYDDYLSLSFEERVALAVEGMRGHLSGDGALGDVEVSYEDKAAVISFAPCGSGGRLRRGDPKVGLSPAGDLPGFGSTEEAHDWSWQRAEVCLYCTHCALTNEILPIERLGFPMRVTENPQDPQDKCRWTIYRDPHDVPAEAYERVGKTKPTRIELNDLWERVRSTNSS